MGNDRLSGEHSELVTQSDDFCTAASQHTVRAVRAVKGEVMAVAGRGIVGRYAYSIEAGSGRYTY